MSNFVVVEDGTQIAGAVVWWSLSGSVDADDLQDACQNKVFSQPGLPSPETVVLRAARHLTANKRQNVRPGFQRGTYVFLQEIPATEGHKGVDVENLVHLSVEYVDEKPEYKIVPFQTDDSIEADARAYLAQAIRDKCKIMEKLYFAEDISAWLLEMLSTVIGAVGLRDRGGFYFVPRDQLEYWRELTGVLKSVSNHRFFEIPAMRTEEAVEAILTATRAEFQEKLQETEQYLQGKVSTRGLNAYERALEEMSLKAKRYAGLLGVALPDIEARVTELTGLTQAAKLIQAEEAARRLRKSAGFYAKPAASHPGAATSRVTEIIGLFPARCVPSLMLIKTASFRKRQRGR